MTEPLPEPVAPEDDAIEQAPAAADDWPSPPPIPHGRANPLLLLFVIFPLIGIVIAIGLMINNNQAGAESASDPATPDAVTLPAAVTLPPVPSPAPVVGAPVIDFALQNLNGETVSLTDFAGREVFLNFWATWCEPCKRELPALAAFSAEQDDDGPVVLAVNSGEDAATVQAYLDERGISGLNVLLDFNTDVTGQYGVFQIPVTFVIDQQGNVRYPHYGEITRDDMIGYLQALNGA